MQPSLNDLKEQIIISPEDIIMLKQDLLKQHPDYSNLQLTQLFFKILHAELDEALYPFEGNLLKKIKYNLLRQTNQKEIFSINAFDVVCAYFKLDLETYVNQTLLISWINSLKFKSSTGKEIAALSDTASSCFSTSDLGMSESAKLEDDISNSSFPPTTLGLVKQNRWLILISGCLVILTAMCFSFYYNIQNVLALKQILKSNSSYSVSLPISMELVQSANYLQPSLQYKEINETALKAWLENRHSLLVTEPYFSTLMETAKSFNINPLLLFSITGQEQGFVPSSHPYALQIANNPFNLYGSWEDYNTSIKESCKIVARTIIRLGKDCPESEDQIKWINHSYAADPNWHNGVSYFLNELELATKLTN